MPELGSYGSVRGREVTRAPTANQHRIPGVRGQISERQHVVNVANGTLQISKIAAAQRQLDAAIRMFFDREDELAIHTVTSAAFQVLRDIIKERGEHFTVEAFRAGILSIARQYANGTLPPSKLAMIKRSALLAKIEPLIADIRDQGDEFDSKRIGVEVSKQLEHKLWLSRATTFVNMLIGTPMTSSRPTTWTMKKF